MLYSFGEIAALSSQIFDVGDFENLRRVALKKTHNSAIFQLSKQKPGGLTESKICVNLRYPYHLRSILIFYAFGSGNKDKISCVCPVKREIGETNQK